MHACFFDVFHYRSDGAVCSVANSIDIDFDGIFEEFVDEDRTLRRGIDRFCHEAFKLFVTINYFHGPAAQNVAWSDKNGIANLVGDFFYGWVVEACGIWRLTESKFFDKYLETLAVFSDIDRIGTCSQYWYARFFERYGKIKGSLAAELNYNPKRLLDLHDI